MARVPDRYVRTDRQGRHWIDLELFFGTRRVPLAAAKVIQRAVRTMEERGDVSPDAKWQAIEFWAADYLAGVTLEDEHG